VWSRPARQRRHGHRPTCSGGVHPRHVEHPDGGDPDLWVKPSQHGNSRSFNGFAQAAKTVDARQPDAGAETAAAGVYGWRIIPGMAPWDAFRHPDDLAEVGTSWILAVRSVVRPGPASQQAAGQRVRWAHAEGRARSHLVTVRHEGRNCGCPACPGPDPARPGLWILRHLPRYLRLSSDLERNRGMRTWARTWTGWLARAGSRPGGVASA